MLRQSLIVIAVSFSLLSIAAGANPPAARPPAPKPRPAAAPTVKKPAPAAKPGTQVASPHTPPDQKGEHRHPHYPYGPYVVVWDYPVWIYKPHCGLSPSEYAAIMAAARSQAVLAAGTSGAAQADSPTGTIVWPAALRGDAFREARQAMERLAAERPATRGTQDLHNREIRKLNYAIRTQLKRSAHELTPTEFAVARMFLDTLERELPTP